MSVVTTTNPEYDQARTEYDNQLQDFAKAFAAALVKHIDQGTRGVETEVKVLIASQLGIINEISNDVAEITIPKRKEHGNVSFQDDLSAAIHQALFPKIKKG